MFLNAESSFYLFLIFLPSATLFQNTFPIPLKTDLMEFLSQEVYQGETPGGSVSHRGHVSLHSTDPQGN